MQVEVHVEEVQVEVEDVQLEVEEVQVHFEGVKPQILKQQSALRWWSDTTETI